MQSSVQVKGAESQSVSQVADGSAGQAATQSASGQVASQATRSAEQPEVQPGGLPAASQAMKQLAAAREQFISQEKTHRSAHRAWRRRSSAQASRQAPAAAACAASQSVPHWVSALMQSVRQVASSAWQGPQSVFSQVPPAQTPSVSQETPQFPSLSTSTLSGSQLQVAAPDESSQLALVPHVVSAQLSTHEPSPSLSW